MRNFRELKIWQKGIDIVVEIYVLTALLPAEEKYGINHPDASVEVLRYQRYAKFISRIKFCIGG